MSRQLLLRGSVILYDILVPITLVSRVFLQGMRHLILKGLTASTRKGRYQDGN